MKRNIQLFFFYAGGAGASGERRRSSQDHIEDGRPSTLTFMGTASISPDTRRWSVGGSRREPTQTQGEHEHSGRTLALLGFHTSNLPPERQQCRRCYRAAPFDNTGGGGVVLQKQQGSNQRVLWYFLIKMDTEVEQAVHFSPHRAEVE